MTKKLARKLLRKKTNKRNKLLQKEMEAKIGMFHMLPDFCLNCKKPFDKRNKEMVQSWYTVVYSQQQKVKLYCPTCWEQGKEILDDFREHVASKIQPKSGGSN